MRGPASWLAAVAFTLAASAAVAGQYVDWLDDGTVLLKLGPSYENAVIETSRAELGSVLGANSSPYAGTTIHLLTHSEGVHGPISGPILAFKPVWEELSGGHVDVGLVPITELYPTMMLDLLRGTRRYDGVVVAAYFYGDLVAQNAMVPVAPFMAGGRFPSWSYDSMPASLRTLYSWDGKGYGVLNDADGQILYYRRDVLTDFANQAAFKKEVGYDLPVPPRTWQQVLDIARFFDGKNWDKHDSQPDHGIVLHLKPGEQGFYHFVSLSAPFAITPGDRVDRDHNVYWFDPTDMKPLINQPGQVAALELLMKLNEYGPAEEIGWRLPQAWEYFLRGKAVHDLQLRRSRGPLRGRDALARQGQVRRRPPARLVPLLGHGEEAVGRGRAAALRGQHHGRLLARRRADPVRAPGGHVLVPLAHGHQAGLEVGRRAWLDRHQPGLPLSDAQASG